MPPAYFESNAKVISLLLKESWYIHYTERGLCTNDDSEEVLNGSNIEKINSSNPI